MSESTYLVDLHSHTMLVETYYTRSNRALDSIVRLDYLSYPLRSPRALGWELRVCPTLFVRWHSALILAFVAVKCRPLNRKEKTVRMHPVGIVSVILCNGIGPVYHNSSELTRQITQGFILRTGSPTGKVGEPAAIAGAAFEPSIAMW